MALYHAVEYAIGETSLILMLPETPAYLALTVVLDPLCPLTWRSRPSSLAVGAQRSQPGGICFAGPPLLLFLFYRAKTCSSFSSSSSRLQTATSTACAQAESPSGWRY